MATAIDEIELPPDAARTIEGLRDTGYDFRTAVADIVDNSIAAGCTRVVIHANLAIDGDLQVTIADNGSGMDKAGLQNAMKYGSQAGGKAAVSLGKFGLGLKTASTSICRQLTVITRSAGTEAPHAAQWDLDYVSERNKWILRRPEVSDADLTLLDEAAPSKSGTVVLWRKIDRLLPAFKYPGAAKKNLEKAVDSLRDHLALTYCRFLTGEAQPKIVITLNRKAVVPWDPFGRAVGSEQVLEREVPAVLDDTPLTFTVRAYVLPPRGTLSPEQIEEAALSTDRQGFYVFRENRVIMSGGWLGMFRIEPHFSLCRIEFSFDNRLDNAFHIDIKKSRIYMLADLQESVRSLISPARAEAENRYRNNERSEIRKEGGSVHNASNAILANRADDLGRSEVRVVGDNQVEVASARGKLVIDVPTLKQIDGGPFVVVRDDLMDGVLWQPGVVDNKKAVLLNAGHPFYQRVYSASSQPLAVQGMNFLLWSLCEAEFLAISEDEREHMRAVRREVSRIVRDLARELPERKEPDTTEVR